LKTAGLGSANPLLSIARTRNVCVPRIEEIFYVVEGEFANEGKQYQAGTSLHFKAGKAHGPHSTKNGCKLLVLWTERTSKEAADLSDFTLASQKAA